MSIYATCAKEVRLKFRLSSMWTGRCLLISYRGPARGFKNHINQSSQNVEGSQQSQAQHSGFSGSSVYYGQDQAIRRNSGSHSPVADSSNRPHILLRQVEPFFGIPTNMVDRLLAVYFTHVHVSAYVSGLFNHYLTRIRMSGH